MCKDLAFRERNNFVNDGGVLPWEQPGYNGQVPSGLPRWIDGHGLVQPCSGKGGWEPVAVTICRNERSKSGAQAREPTSEHGDTFAVTGQPSQGVCAQSFYFLQIQSFTCFGLWITASWIFNSGYFMVSLYTF